MDCFSAVVDLVDLVIRWVGFLSLVGFMVQVISWGGGSCYTKSVLSTGSESSDSAVSWEKCVKFRVEESLLLCEAVGISWDVAFVLAGVIVAGCCIFSAWTSAGIGVRGVSCVGLSWVMSGGVCRCGKEGLCSSSSSVSIGWIAVELSATAVASCVKVDRFRRLLTPGCVLDSFSVGDFRPWSRFLSWSMSIGVTVDVVWFVGGS